VTSAPDVVPPAQAGLPALPSLADEFLRLVAFGATSVVVAGGAAVVYRWYVRDRIGTGLATLLALGVVAFYLQAVGLFGDLTTGNGGTVFRPETVAFNLLALAIAAAGAPLGRYVGDRVATDVLAASGAKELEGDVGRFARNVARVTAVTLPGEVDDIENYDPVPDATKEALAGKTLVFPRRVTVPELADRLVARLKEDYAVGHVDVELTDEGEVTFLAVGMRVAGLGPTLPPGSAAVAVRADPPANAGPGDVVQVWSTDPEPARLLTAELRAAVDDVATLVVDETEANRLGEGEHRLVTLPAEPRADREFAGLLRAADETMGAVVVDGGSDLAGEAVGALDATVVAVRPVEGPVDAVPSRARTVAAGETLYVVARPEAIRRLETRAGGTAAA
jgi:hypothetical protein